MYSLNRVPMQIMVQRMPSKKKVVAWAERVKRISFSGSVTGLTGESRMRLRGPAPSRGSGGGCDPSLVDWSMVIGGLE